jgi:hypothetical protein
VEIVWTAAYFLLAAAMNIANAALETSIAVLAIYDAALA